MPDVFTAPKAPTWPSWKKFNSRISPAFYFKAATGSDANNGRSAGTAWQTWPKLIAAIGNGTIPANGTIILVSGDGPMQLAAPLVLAGRTLRSDTPGTYAKVVANVALPAVGWTNPSGAIWKLAAGATTRKRATVRYNVAGTMTMFPTPVIGANFAAVTAALQANAGSYWADPANGDLYVHTPAGGSPNSDGVSYDYCPDYTLGLDGLLIDAGGGTVDGIWLDGGGTLDPTGGSTGSAGNPISQAMGTNDLSVITKITNCKRTGYTKHAFELAANNETGSYTCLNCVAGPPPPGFFSGSYSAFVTYCSTAAGNGTAVTNHTGCNDGGGGFTTHNNGIGVKQFLRQEFHDGTFGQSGLGAAETAATITSGMTFTGPSGSSATTWTSTDDTFQGRTFGNGGAVTMTRPTLTVGTAFTDTPTALSGTLTITNPAFDLTGGNNFTTAWTRAGAYSFRMTGGFIRTINNTNYALFEAFTLGVDTFTANGTNVRGDFYYPLIHNYNATGQPYSWKQAFTDGLLTNCTRDGHALAAVTSPVPATAGSTLSDWWDFIGGDQWQDLTENVNAAAGNLAKVISGTYWGARFKAPDDAHRGTRTAAGLVLGTGHGYTAPNIVLTAGATGYFILIVEKLTGAAGSTRTIQSDTIGNRIMAIGRNDGNPCYVGGTVSNFSVTPDGLRHVAMLNCPASGGGNVQYWVDGDNRTTGAIAATDWGQVSIGVGGGGAGAAAESANTTLVCKICGQKFLSGGEVASWFTLANALP